MNKCNVEFKGFLLSLKENIDMVRSELSSEEKFFEKAVVTERFVKKYKMWMIGSVVAIIVLVGANIVYDAQDQERIVQANSALRTLEKDNTNEEALRKLKENSQELYNVWRYAQAIAQKDSQTLQELKKSKTLVVKDLAEYESAKSVEALDSYAKKQGAIYKDLALIQSAVLLLQENKVEKAHQKLASVSQDSSFAQLAKILSHYGVK